MGQLTGNRIAWIGSDMEAGQKGPGTERRMKDGFIKVAAVTPKVRVADVQYNTGEVIRLLKEAAEEGAKIIAFPELVLTGYTCNDLFLQSALLRETRAGLAKVVRFTEGIRALVFVGMPLEVDGKLYNTAAVLSDGKLLGFVPKRAIPNYSEYYEQRYFSPGNEKTVPVMFDGHQVPMGSLQLFECDMTQPGADAIGGMKVACEICEDLWMPDPPSTRLAMAGANVIVNLSASVEVTGKSAYRRDLVRMTSGRLVAAYLYASAGEGESSQDLVFSGQRLIAENGSMLADSGRFTTGITYAQIDIDRLQAERRRITTFACRRDEDVTCTRFDLDVEETRLEREFDPKPFVPSSEEHRASRCEEIFQIQALGLKKRLEHIGAKSAVIGISGGLDSTLALLVCVRAFDMLSLDPAGIHAITMPAFGTTDRTYRNAVAMSKALGCSLQEINIKKAVMQHFADIGHDPSVTDVTYENAQARERTQVLMDLANQTGGIVIGTGDLSELALGWATYNGDHMSMYAVNSSVPKTLVRHLVHYYAQNLCTEDLRHVLEDVLDTPVSPELLPPQDGQIAQKTEDLVGPYELHDFFLYYVLRFGFAPSKVYRIAKRAFEGRFDDGTILKWLRKFYWRFFSQQYKRSCVPDGPKVGTVAVSPRGDLRMPSDACVALWQKDLDRLGEC
jgi:NAD+ synthase (glutamine-hydrolysing)